MNYKHFTQEEIDFIKNNYNKMTGREMGKILGKSDGSVLNKLKRLGIEKGREKRIRYKRVPCQYPKLGDCWNCTSHGKDSYWYPIIMRNGKASKISRYAWKLRFGKIPDGICVLHKCDNRRCINPDHLFLGTRKDNIQDMIRKGRSKRKLTTKQTIEIFKSTEPGEVLADKYNVSIATISHIRNRKTYKEITAKLPYPTIPLKRASLA